MIHRGKPLPHLDAKGERRLAGRIVRRHLHIQRLTRVSKIFRREDGTLLTDKQSSGVSVPSQRCVPVTCISQCARICAARAEEKQKIKRQKSSQHTYVLQPTLSGHMLRSATLRPWTPWTLRRSSRTPCLTMLLPSLGAIEQVCSNWSVSRTHSLLFLLPFSGRGETFYLPQDNAKSTRHGA